MSAVPQWKQAIYDRRKRQEEEEKRRKDEDDAYLASLPPWKRALLLKQREKQHQADAALIAQFDQPRSPVHVAPTQKKEPSPAPRGGRGGSSAAASAPAEPRGSVGGSTYAHTRTNQPATPAFKSPSRSTRYASPPPPSTASVSSQRRSSITVLPEDASGVGVSTSASVSSHGPVSLRPKPSQPAVDIQEKRRSFEESEDPKLANMPAWKKALILKRRATQSSQSSSGTTKQEAQDVQHTRSSPVGREVEEKPSMPSSRVQHHAEEFNRRSPSPLQRGTSPTPRQPSPVPGRISPYHRETSPTPWREQSPVSGRVSPVRNREISPTFQREPSPVPQREPSPTPWRGVSPTPRREVSPTPSSKPEALLSRSKPAPKEPADEGVVLLHSRTFTTPEPMLAETRKLDEKPSSSRKASQKPKGQKEKSARSRAKKSSKKDQSDDGIVLLSSRRIGSPEPEAPPPVPSITHERKVPPTGQGRRPAPPPPVSKAPQGVTSSTREASPQRVSVPPTRSRAKPQPEIVNRPSQESTVPNKLVEQEGITLHPPVFKEVDTWANVPEDDPKFLALPHWKQALIKRRRADIVKRTTSPPPTSPPPDKPKHIHTQWSPRNSLADARSPELPQWKLELVKRQQTDRSSASRNYGLERSKPETKPNNVTSSGGVQALLDKFNKAPPPPRPTIVRQSPPRTVPIPWEDKNETKIVTVQVSPDEEDSTSDSSDSDVDEIPLTNIDELSSDEVDDEDSGISTKGDRKPGKKRYSYSLLPESPTEPSPDTLTVPSAGESDGLTGGIREQRRPSILIDSDNSRPRKGLRVCFSDSDLAVEHFYPKYDYSDYKDIQEENSDDERELTGLSLRVHPSLRSALTQPVHPSLRSSASESNVSSRSSLSPPPPTSPEANTDLHRYTPKLLSSYQDEIQQHLSGNYSVSVGSDSRDEATDYPDGQPVEEPPIDDFYASFGANPSALMW